MQIMSLKAPTAPVMKMVELIRVIQEAQGKVLLWNLSKLNCWLIRKVVTSVNCATRHLRRYVKDFSNVHGTVR